VERDGPARAPGPVALHLRVLEKLEHGDRDGAARALADLRRRAPDYAPALLEDALERARSGERRAAAKLMRELLARVKGLVDDAVVEGPEPLPVSFYRATAEAFLEGGES
jgi:hypothetical protein